MIFSLFDGEKNYILIGVLCVVAAYLTFYICELLYSVFYRFFDKTQRVAANPLLTLKSLYNAASALMLLLFGACWKGQSNGKSRAGVIVASLLTALCNAAMAIVFYIVAAFLAATQLSMLFPISLFFRAMFIANASVLVFSACPLPPFLLGNIILSLLPEKAAEKFEKLRPYSVYLLVAVAALLGRGGVFKEMYDRFAYVTASFWDLIF